MTDTGVTMVGTLSQKNLFPPGLMSQVKAAKDDDTIHNLGVIFGKVRGLSLRSNVFGEEPSKAFTGIFEGIPAHGGRYRSTSCFLPRAINDTLTAAVVGDHKMPIDRAPKRGEKIEVTGLNELTFAISIAVQHDDSEVGFRYVCTMHGQDAFALQDPFADLRPLIPGTELGAQPSLPAGASLSIRAMIGAPTISGPSETRASKPGKTVAKAKRRKAA
jgi:hypothetical protein